MTTLTCLDFETTSVDVATATVVQAALVSTEPDGLRFSEHCELFAAKDVPEDATAIHKITDRDPERFPFPVTLIPPHAPPFASVAASVVSALTADDVVGVSYNGAGFDLPILARIAAPVLGQSADVVLARLMRRHVDVMRLWARAKAAEVTAPWAVLQFNHEEPFLPATVFAGTLSAAHAFWLGDVFDGAHGAAKDCKATLGVLLSMIRERFVDLETAIRWSSEPLPGDVDFAGKFKWRGGDVVITFGKHSGQTLSSLPTSYLRWVLGADFHESTKQVVADFLAGRLPKREG